MKLFSKEEIVISPEPVLDRTEVDNYYLDQDIDNYIQALEHHVEAYDSITNITTSVSFESFNFVDQTNVVLFNEYLTNLKKNLDVPAIENIATESNLEEGYELKHYQLSLEGIVASIWEGIKKAFRKIIDTIAEFSKKHFTRLGRVKKRLENVVGVLGKTDKDIQELVLEKVPGRIAASFPFEGSISEQEVLESITSAQLLEGCLKVINDDAQRLAKASVLDREFVAKMKSLIDKAKEAETDKVNVSEVKGIRNKLGAMSDNRELEKSKQAAQKEVGKMEEDLSSVTGDEELDDDKGQAAAQAEVSKYFEDIAKELEKVKDRKLPGGKVITEVKVDETGIDITSEVSKDKPTSVSLGSKSSLQKIAKTALDIVTRMEATTKDYAKVNDVVLKSLDDVDRLIKDLDRLTENASAAKYKKKLQTQVKTRLKIMQSFFGNYNKLNKNFMSMILDVGDGVAVYSTESLKRFG